MKLIISYQKWEKLDDVPQLTLDWAKLIAGDMVKIEEVNELVTTYEEWLSQFNS